nr:hypothetical protein [Methylonatrum kenyense]
MADLTPDEVAAIAEHEHTDLMVAAEMGAYLVHTEEGQARIARMIVDDIEDARRNNKPAHAAKLRLVLQHFVREHGNLDFDETG